MFRNIQEMTTEEIENELNAIEIYEKEIVNVDVDSLLDKTVDTSFLKTLQCTVTPNRQLFRIDRKGFLPEIMESMYLDRSKFKKMMIEAEKKLEVTEDENERKELVKQISRYNNLQLSKKTSLNSAYGALGNEFFRLFDIRQAEGITTAGQLSIRWNANKLNRYMNKILNTENVEYVIYIDTDSNYLHLGPLVNAVYGVDGVVKMPKEKIIDFMDRICKEKIQPFIDKSYRELAEYVNAFEQKMSMKREVLADKGLWVAKKRYILNVYDNEGVRYSEPHLKIQGLEAIKSSTPSACRDKIKEAIQIIFNGTQSQLQDYIKEFKTEFKKIAIEDIAFPRSVNGMNTYSNSKTIFTKGTPIHVKGALIYNHFLNKNNLNKKYETIKDGEKIKFIMLKEPNIFKSPVIAFVGAVPQELNLTKWVDYETQFQKSFVDPLKIILECIGWTTEKVNSLESFFV